ncbi:MAG: nucleoside deaminase [Bacteroidota bacterium]|nr:nucleoside deaminase [Bacteroidota bacterium]
MENNGNKQFFLNEALREAQNGMRNNLGGPFGAVVVKDGKIIGRGCNRVTSDNDPTAHAEIVAIREACRNAGTFDLGGAEIYSTCEPCPMCLSAIYWSNIRSVIYSATRHDAENIGFRDNMIYEEINEEPAQRMIPFQQINDPEMHQLFEEWKKKIDKIPY